MNYSIQQIAEIVKGELFLRDEQYTQVAHLLTDSRKITSAENSLFFPIKGDRRDGHEFIPELANLGVCNFLISKNNYVDELKQANFVVVPDTLEALQTIAAYHRKQFNFPVIGITGSNGKTIVKEWLYQLMREDKHIVRSPKSYNSQIGVPLSVWQMKSENDLAVFEAGISLPGEMKKLEEIIQPTIGVFTNIGSAHDENFSSLEEKIKEKLQLFLHVQTLIYCKDYISIAEEINKTELLPEDQKYFTWSRKFKADLQIGRISKNTGESEIQGIYKNNFIKINIPFTDEASIENAIHCWAMLLFFNYDNEIISRRMELLSPVAMRLEMKEGINSCSIINDSYNSDIGSLTIALDFLNQQKQHPNKTIILSDILQSGKDEESLYKEVADLLVKKGIKKLIGIGESISRQQHAFKTEKKFFKTTDDFLREFNATLFNDETILIKGARLFGFERISKILQQKAHETVLEINLNAVLHNYNFYRSRLRPETKVMVMVKAFSYGSGSFEIASVLQFHRADYLSVAYADEGIELRKAGITLPIMVMSPEEQSFDAMIDYKLEPEIYNFKILKYFSEALKRKMNESFQHYPIHLKFDTGMHRLGFEEGDINQLIVRLKNNKQVKVISVFSHLAGSDEQMHDGFTKEQIAKFERMCGNIADHVNYPVMRHILNSAGILRFPEAQYEMVRLGIGLHGIAASAKEQKHLQPVATLKSTVLQIKNVKAGDTVGYSRKGIAQKDTQVATVAIGYADGYNRKFSNGIGSMLVNSKRAPVIGNVCMDMTMIDVTDIPCKEGNEVIIFGNEYTVTQLAETIGTITYEILTSIPQRVKRVYLYE